MMELHFVPHGTRRYTGIICYRYLVPPEPTSLPRKPAFLLGLDTGSLINERSSVPELFNSRDDGITFRPSRDAAPHGYYLLPIFSASGTNFASQETGILIR